MHGKPKPSILRRHGTYSLEPARAPAINVIGGLADQRCVILEFTEGGVAIVAEHPAMLSGRVTVVKHQATPPGLLFAAQFASRSFRYFGGLVFRQPIAPNELGNRVLCLGAAVVISIGRAPLLAVLLPVSPHPCIFANSARRLAQILCAVVEAEFVDRLLDFAAAAGLFFHNKPITSFTSGSEESC